MPALIKEVSDLVARTELTFIEKKQLEASDPNLMRNTGIFQSVPFPDGIGNSRAYTSLDIQKYAKIKPYAASVELSQNQQGYTKSFEMQRMALNVDLYWEDIHQSKYNQVAKITSLVGTVSNRLELMLAHHFSFATATTYTNMEGQTVNVAMGDTYAMGYSAHTLNGSATTYRTILAGNPQLSRGCLEGLEGLFLTESYNELGQNDSANYRPDTVLITRDPNTCNTMRILNMSMADPTVSNSGVVNVYKGKYKIIENDNIRTDANGIIDTTKSKYVFLIDSKAAQRNCFLAIQEEEHLIPPTSIENDSNATDKITYGVRGVYGSVIVDPKFVRMTKGDGTA